MAATAVVARANDPIEANIWVDALRDAGIQAAAFETGAGAALGGATAHGFAAYPIVVARDDLAHARNVIADLAGGAALAPFPNDEAAAASRRRIIGVAASVIGLFVAVGVLVRAFDILRP